LRSVIFLDIDGVLAPIVERDRYGDVEPSCVQVLNDIVARSGADVVVSSSWRFSKTTDEMQRILDAHGFSGRVVDRTPTDARGLLRWEEITAWLEEHPVDRCVILDDHGNMGPLSRWLVQTEPAVGLRPADADRALSRLADGPIISLRGYHRTDGPRHPSEQT
jgi:hypothetical protein